jgi:SAM-dependent methyltransferase
MTLTPIDFQTAWAKSLHHRPNPRLQPEEDRAFWEGYAERYDRRAGLPESATQTLAILSRLVRPTDSVLDVGAGTGRFALPLAAHVRHVTALDQSVAMLDLLMQKAKAVHQTNLTCLEADWPVVAVEPHDLVLAAWSLYRQIDLAAALTKLVAATRRTLVIVGGVGGNPPHRPLVEQICGNWTESVHPGHLYIAGTLWELGLLADIQVVYEQRTVVGATQLAIAELLAPAGTPPTAIAQLAEALASLLRRNDQGWHYTYQQAVGVVVWHVERTRTTDSVT